MDEQTRQALEKRRLISSKRPKFVRQESWRYVRVKEAWRKPKGIDSKMRKQEKGWPCLVKIGYRGPKDSRYIHPSGLIEKLVHNVSELEELVPGREAARIAASVGAKKRVEILKRAKELGIRILNPGRLRVIEPKK